MGSREGTSAEPEEPADNAITFDCSLPAMHTYLGQNLEELPGHTVLDEWSYHTFPLLPMRGVFLVPGQTLPMNEIYPTTVKMMTSCIQSDHLFGSLGLVLKGNCESYAEVGTLAEIYEWHLYEHGDSISVKAIGRQRFRLINVDLKPHGSIVGKVQILPEIILPDPMAEIRLGTLNRFRIDAKTERSLLRLDAMTAQWPSWVYSQYRLSTLIAGIEKILRPLNLDPNTVVPKDPVALSFWLIRAIPLGDEDKVTMLRLNSAIMRLQYVLKIHKKRSTVLCCTHCNALIANMTDAFTMSVEGAMGSYVNPNGFIHEIITVHKANNLELCGRGPSNEFSWFPGYAWRIAQCESCLGHIGWRFTTVNSNLKPSSFWALATRSVDCQSVKDDPENEKDV